MSQQCYTVNVRTDLLWGWCDSPELHYPINISTHDSGSWSVETTMADWSTMFKVLLLPEQPLKQFHCYHISSWSWASQFTSPSYPFKLSCSSWMTVHKLFWKLTTFHSMDMMESSLNINHMVEFIWFTQFSVHPWLSVSGHKRKSFESL
jgi:hypothetical protein